MHKFPPEFVIFLLTILSERNIIKHPIKGDYMNKSLRPAVIAGNWKMNKTPDEAVTL